MIVSSPTPTKLHTVENNPGMLMFQCPGCKCSHAIYTGEWKHPGPKWGWNGSFDRPTFTPSILVKSTEFTEKGREQYRLWMEESVPLPEQIDSRPTVCHSYVDDGKIQFLNDSTHSLAGQTIELPDWD